MNLKLETPSLKRKEEAIEYIKEFYEHNSPINGVGGLHKHLENYEAWLNKIETDKNRIPTEEKVPAETYFLVREEDNKIVGMINIRTALNETLKNYAGHIGYSIRPTERQKGYNKINLYLALQVLKEHNVKTAILGCRKDNIASKKTILSLGGIMLAEKVVDGEEVEQYGIDIEKTLTQKRDEYSQ